MGATDRSPHAQADERAWCGAARCPDPRKAGLCFPDPFRRQGYLSSPDCPGGSDKGVCGLKGPSSLVWEPPREKVGPKASLKRGGAVI